MKRFLVLCLMVAFCLGLCVSPALAASGTVRSTSVSGAYITGLAEVVHNKYEAHAEATTDMFGRATVNYMYAGATLTGYGYRGPIGEIYYTKSVSKAVSDTSTAHVGTFWFWLYAASDGSFYKAINKSTHKFKTYSDSVLVTVSATATD